MTDTKNAVACSTCNDTHTMPVTGFMCTRCPLPCQKCRAGGTGPYCEQTPCSCGCHATSLSVTRGIESGRAIADKFVCNCGDPSCMCSNVAKAIDALIAAHNLERERLRKALERITQTEDWHTEALVSPGSFPSQEACNAALTAYDDAIANARALASEPPSQCDDRCVGLCNFIKGGPRPESNPEPHTKADCIDGTWKCDGSGPAHKHHASLLGVGCAR